MCEKLLTVNNASVEELVKRINEIVGEKFEILDEKDDIEKWNSVPKLLLLDDVAQKRLLSFIEFLDSIPGPIETKAIIIVSLAGLMEFANIKLYNYDDGSLYTMADYYQNSSIEDIRKTISIIGNNDLLQAVRRKTLELNIRNKILLGIEKRCFNDKIDTTNLNLVSEFISKIIKELEEKDYYELINE